MRSDRRLAYVLNGILNSSLTTFQLVFGGGAFGLERSTVEPQDLLSLRIPDLKAADPEAIQKILIAEAANAERPGDIDLLRQLDEAVADLYELDRHELTVTQDSVARARILISESRTVRNAAVRPPSPDQLADYAFAAMTVVNGYLKAKGERRLTATIYDRSLLNADWSQGAPGLTAVRYHMERSKVGPHSEVWFGSEPGSELVTDLLDRQLPTDGQPPYLNERRQFRLYIDGDLIVVKPSEARYWTRTVGLNDADLILADHWLGTIHVRA